MLQLTPALLHTFTSDFRVKSKALSSLYIVLHSLMPCARSTFYDLISATPPTGLTSAIAVLNSLPREFPGQALSHCCSLSWERAASKHSLPAFASSVQHYFMEDILSNHLHKLKHNPHFLFSNLTLFFFFTSSHYHWTYWLYLLCKSPSPLKGKLHGHWPTVLLSWGA